MRNRSASSSVSFAAILRRKLKRDQSPPAWRAARALDFAAATCNRRASPRRKPSAVKAQIRAKPPATNPDKISGMGSNRARNGMAARSCNPSPIIPPSPARSGQEVGTGQAAKHAAESGTNRNPRNQRRIFGAPIRTARMAPPIIRARPATQADQPNSWRIISANTAPPDPNRFSTARSLAAFQLGSSGS